MTEEQQERNNVTLVRMALASMQQEVVRDNTARGWYDRDVPIAQALLLLHTEVSEAAEAYRKWGFDDATHIDGIGPNPKPEGVASEFADVLIRLLDDCARYGYDLADEYFRKMAYNRTREYRHGGKNF